VAYTSGTFTGQPGTGYYLYNNVVKPFLTSVGAPWSFVEDYQPGGPSTGPSFSVWKSAAASNHSGMDWYLVFQYYTPVQNPTQQTLVVYACEVYSTSGHTWNRCLFCSGNTGYASTYSTTYFDAANQRAYTAASLNVVGTTYVLTAGVPSQTPQQVGQGPSMTTNGTFSYFLVANADGFCLAVGVGASFFLYVGAFSSLLPVGGPLGTDQPLVMTSQMSTNWQAGLSRDPLANGGVTTYPYFYQFFPYGLGMGTVNGVIDSFQGGPWASRIGLQKPFAATGPGYYRGILPTWMVALGATSCAFLDSVTINGDSYVYSGWNIGSNAFPSSPYVFVDTTA
jgi:hypothetical protein